MYVCRLWIQLVDASERGYTPKLIEALKLQLQNIETVPGNAINQVNCDWVLQFSVSHNHTGDAQERLLKLLNWIVKHLPERHGAVFWMDDEIGLEPLTYQLIVLQYGLLTHYDKSPLGPITD